MSLHTFSIVASFISLSLTLHPSASLAKGQLSGASAPALASEAFDTPDFADFETKALELAQVYGAENVLVAYDIDNTLLATNQYLGGDQWYNWQSAEMKKPQPNDAITQDPEAFAQICAKLLTLSLMHPPEASIPATVRRLQEAGITSVALTARRYDLRDITSLALQDNGIDFTKQALGSIQGYPDTFLPYELAKPEAYGLSKDLVKSLNLEAPRPVSYSRGMIMAGGIQKGIVLRSLMHKTKRSFKAILFIDDAVHNTKDVQAAFTDTPITVMTFRYGREDQKVKEFQASDKSEVKRSWAEFKVLMDRLFPKQAT